MKDSATNTLGYLGAFTLGVICMAAIFMAMRGRPVPQPGAETKPVEENPMPAPPRPQTFQRLRPPGSKVEQAVVRAETAEVREAETEKTREEEKAPELSGPPERVISRVESVVVPVAAPQASLIATRGGRISGRVRLRGDPPPERVIPMDTWCGAFYKTPSKTRFYVTGKDHSLADVIVVLSDGIPLRNGAGGSKDPLTLNEIGCQMEPYISAIQTGQTVLVQNRDKTLHNLHVTSADNGEFKRAQLPKGSGAEIVLRQPERFVQFKCDLHPWEFAYVSVIEHPFFAVTDRNGNFVMTNVPPGKYTIEAYHRKAGDSTKQIEVEANGSTTIEFALDVANARTAAN